MWTTGADNYHELLGMCHLQNYLYQSFCSLWIALRKLVPPSSYPEHSVQVVLLVSLWAPQQPRRMDVLRMPSKPWWPLTYQLKRRPSPLGRNHWASFPRSEDQVPTSRELVRTCWLCLTCLGKVLTKISILLVLIRSLIKRQVELWSLEKYRVQPLAESPLQIKVIAPYLTSWTHESSHSLWLLDCYRVALSWEKAGSS